MPFHVYILQSLKDGSYYIGSTNNLEESVERHSQGRSQYTKSKLLWKRDGTSIFLLGGTGVRMPRDEKGQVLKSGTPAGTGEAFLSQSQSRV
jgi:putative endonuclease